MVGSDKYIAGHASGDATVFDFESGENLGAVPFAATNASKLEGMEGLELGRAVADLESQSSWAAQVGINTTYGDPSTP